MKAKNPLYVVKGQNVEEVKNLLEMLLKKFDLEPALRMLEQLLSLLLSQVQSYPAFVVVKNVFDQWLAQLLPLLQQVSGVFAKS